MDDSPTRMMHPVGSQVGMIPQPYGMQPVDPNQGPTTPEQDVNRKQDIGEILQQIMNITDQSLDEAQARYLDAFYGPFCQLAALRRTRIRSAAHGCCVLEA
jgi:hypothetical protein